MDPTDREYYRTTWGFDPVRARIPLDETGTRFKYEAGFLLDNDPDLDATGATLWARVEFDASTGEVHNGLVIKFPHGPRPEYGFHCIHTVVYSGSVDEVSTLQPADLAQIAQTADPRPIHLSPEEHFVALRSFVAGIAEIGLQAVASKHPPALGGMDPDDLPLLGFNLHLRLALLEELERIRREIVKLPDLHPEVIARLATDRQSEVLLALARRPDTPPATLLVLATRPHPLDLETRAAIATHPAAPPEALTALSLAPEPYLLEQVATHLATPPATLARLAGHEIAFLRERVARHPETPPATLLSLARDPVFSVRRAVAANPASSPHALATLATPGELFVVRVAVAGNPRTPSTVLQALASDPAPKLQQVARLNLAGKYPPFNPA